MDFIRLHDSSVFTDEDELEMFQDVFIPEKARQCKAAQQDLHGMLTFLPVYLFNAFRLKRVDQEKIRACLQLLLQSFHAEVEFNLTDQDSVELNFGGQKVLHPVDKNQRTGVMAWNMGFYYALIARAAGFTKYLGESHSHSLMITPDLYSPFFQKQHQFLIELGTEMESKMLENAETELANLSPELAPVQHIYFPLWRPVIEKNQNKFDSELRAAFARHIAYWGQAQGKDKDHPNDPSGHYNFYLTGIMAYAFDQGLEVKIDSDYTPNALVRGDFQVDLKTELPFYF